MLSVTENADPLVEPHSGELSENYSDWNAADVEFWVRAALVTSVQVAFNPSSTTVMR